MTYLTLKSQQQPNQRVTVGLLLLVQWYIPAPAIKYQ